ncbi:hypothetical protein AURDEDRAFT_167315 [Auricularia subglabra TFB-10046 SS5]|nr:hypothetical protein AURDEDRAFT_167315 [Auricularia subglabra TFB-10046 SS5]
MATRVESSTMRFAGIFFSILLALLAVLALAAVVFLLRAYIRIRQKRQCRATPLRPPRPSHPLDSVDLEDGPLPCLDCTIRMGVWHAAQAHAAQHAPRVHFPMASHSTNTDDSNDIAGINAGPAPDTEADIVPGPTTPPAPKVKLAEKETFESQEETDITETASPSPPSSHA